MSLRATAWQSPPDLSKRDCHVAIAPRNDMMLEAKVLSFTLSPQTAHCLSGTASSLCNHSATILHQKR